ncbi:two-component system sensor histidine kinase RegB [Litoreibacter ponti]|uniref:histidine kinase n=1 Tax=Litoreibacter ponti TaxID=1510457 RepID=A0A2T6BQ66_9RHOB|nr:ActS/PrrB/RegB family redox-sensitive histidine kinase [Litoreibacter ponti]PTX58107.1 two-component system sensor histidine kinase RegB [Litoreibacter ponti]
MVTAPLGLEPGRGRGGVVRLRTLIILRWLAVSGQIGAIVVASLYLQLEIELGLCVMAIGASVITNLVAIFVYPENRRLPEREVLVTLLFDLSQLAFLLYLTGGLNNPFALLILAPVTVSAMTLRTSSTLFLAALAVVLVTVLAVFYLPLRNENGFVLRMPQLFVLGFWVAMIIGIGFLSIYASRVTAETTSMSQALLATQMALSREQKLTDLGGVVAAAAHELGTPLATIKLVSSELVDELDDPDLKEDAELIREQADRCRDILHSMGRAGKDDLHLRTAPLSSVVQEAAEPHSHRGIEINYDFSPRTGTPPTMPSIHRHPEIIHGLRNLVQNAVDFAKTRIWVEARWSDSSVTVRVIDDGPGYPTDLLGRIGDPFIKRGEKRERDESRPEYEGMGLGLFIAKTLLERSGAEISFANGSDGSASSGNARSGAIAEVVWPATAIVEDRGETSRALGENKPIPI